MKARNIGASSSIFLLILLSLLLFINPAFAIKKSYVIYLGAHSHGHDASSIDYDRVKESHYSFLGSLLGNKEKARDAIFDSYTHHINGFAANIDESVANELSRHPNVISVFLNRERELHTTRSWEFMDLEHGGIVPKSSLWNKARYGEDVIIGVIDTGVWPESPSFQDNEMGPIPANWKGICQNDRDPKFHCNRKLIGARYFNQRHAFLHGPHNSTYNTPRDWEGHGTHCLSTVGGNFVTGVDVMGQGYGTAKGGSPKARLASYKVCWLDLKCSDSDILAAYDMAIHDGVHVISISIGGGHSYFHEDGVYIGSFHAVKHGITVISSAGNDGPVAKTVGNIAPWQITVAASTLDRRFPTYLVLGNNRSIRGESLSEKALENKYYPIVSSKSVKAANASVEHANLCKAGSLDPKKVKGKILVCLRGDTARVEKGHQASLAGAAGMILANDQASGNAVVSDPHVLPVSHINYSDGLDVYAYISSTRYPMAYITHPTTELHTKPSPSMASFSSQGPNVVVPEILKPDISAPGVSTIAAFGQGLGPTMQPFDKRRILYNAISGTSMACPHVTGVVGLLKTMHPEWSPSAIKSAIMTSSRTRNNAGKPITDSTNVKATPFSYGAGHIRPNRAMDPGLVYDLTYKDYLSFLCSEGYSETQIRILSEGSFKCPKPMINPLDFNYPSITVPNLRGSVTVSRTLKNVGKPGIYHATFVSPPGYRVNIYPKTLEFKSLGEEKTFKVTINATRNDLGKDYMFGRLRWSDGKHFVRSPIVVRGIIES